MDIENHKKEFDRIIEKYNLSSDENAEKIASYLTKHPLGKITLEEFSIIFEMEEEDVITFLSFIHKGIQFKQDHIDKN